MKSRFILRGLLAIAMLWIQQGYAQLTKAEYFFDTDPGNGNGYSLDMSLTGVPEGAPFNISFYSGSIAVPANLNNGWHTVFIRTLDATKGWSICEGRPFRVQRATSPSNNIEYFFDTDPGVGNGLKLSVPITPGAHFDAASFTGSIPVPASLAKGWHQLYFRMWDANGGWGIYEAKPFFVVDNGSELDRLEYFFDTDPGVGKGTALGFQSAGTSSSTFDGSLNTAGLSAGTHTLYVRARHLNGSWSNVESRPFYVKPVIDAAEWFVDTDPGAGNGEPISITAGNPLVSYAGNITLPGCLTIGAHKLYVRSHTSDGLWGIHEVRDFTINQTSAALALSAFPTVMHPCTGNAFDVTFTSSGVYAAGNTFTVQLSNATGDFSAPVNIGTLTVSPSGCKVPNTISVSIPEGTANGTGYRIRVISSNPVQQADSARNIVIQPGNTYYRDADGDGFGNEFATSIACTQPAGYVSNGNDCNDDDAGVHEGIRYYIDADGDGFGAGTGELICASSAPTGYSANNTDCNDGDVTVFAPKAYYADADGDGFGAGPVVMLCSANAPSGYSLNNTDCNDSDATINAPKLYYVDSDGDGFGTGAGVMLCASSAPAGYATKNTDCNDANNLVNTPQPYYVDADGDGYGAGVVVMLCSHIAPAGYSANNTDCNDADALVHATQRYYVDADGDGYGTGDGALFCSSTIPAGYSANNQDCNDADALQKPGQIWFTDADGDGYATGTSVTQCARPVNGRLASELTATSGDCDDNNAQVTPAKQTLTFSGNAGFENSLISPATGTPYTTFNFEVKYTDATNALPPYGYPRVLLDYEGDGNYTGGNDRTIVMSPADVSDNTTSDGKIYRGSISQLATGTNWKSSVMVVNGACSTQTSLANYPVVQVLPDLEIFANDISISASNPPVASPLTVSATIYNRSDFAAENFVARLINQYSPSVDYGDIVVATIPAHGSTVVTWNITTPVDPAWCPLQVVIDATNLIDETNELNNTALRPFTNGNYNVPGAIEVTANASPGVSYVSPGASIGISGKAIYTGTVIPLADPSVAGAEVNFTLLETGQTYKGVTNSAGNFSIGIPRPTTPGVYHVQGTTTDFTLTGAFTTQFTVIVPPCLPDLTSQIRLSANQIVEGQTVNAEFKITNNGCAATAPTRLSINQAAGSPSTAGTFDVPALAPGASFTRTVNNILFATRGNYGFSLTADANATEIEQSEDNNTSYTYVNVLPGLPDIEPYDGSRGSYAFCGSLPTSVSYILRNSGGTSSGAFVTQVKVYLDGVFVQTLTHNVPGIAAQGLYSFSLPYNFTSTGNYTFEVLMDVPHPNGVVEEVSEANNTAVYGITIYACPPAKVNLILLGESCQRSTTVDPVDPAFPGSMTLTARAYNAGNLTAAGPIQVRFSLSNGTSYLGTYAGDLAPGETGNVSVTVPTVAPATNTLTATVDPNDLVEESNELDNQTGPESLCWNFRPTLYCQTQPWGQRYVVNQSFQPRIEVVAEGLYYASQVKVRFEVAGPGIAGTINLGDAILDNPRRVCAPYCHPVASLPSTFVFQQNGVYTFTMTVDPDNRYKECNEGDNVIVLNVTVVNQPDLRILSQYINPSKLNPDVSEPVSLLVSYENLGANNINDRMKMKVLVDEVELATVSNVAGLVNGDKATIAIPTPWSSPLVGAHVIRAIIDSDNEIAEANETNNEATRAIIVGALANLRFTSFAPSNTFPSVGEAITLNATIWNDGDEATDGEVEFLYINANGDSIQIGKLPVSVIAGGTQHIQLPWFVTQTPAKLVARIINATLLEATYDDNVATSAIGLFSVVVNSEDACGPDALGKLTAVVTGGKAPFTYAWSNGTTGAQMMAMSGTFQVTVTDANGRTTSGEGTIGTSAGTVYYADADRDGFGTNNNTVISCTGTPVGYVSNQLDCNDANPAINPAATEVCDGVDNDCDGLIDEGFNKTWYRDADNDGYGNAAMVQTNCTKPAGYIAQAGDCNDSDATIYPDAPELCDSKDNDCDGLVDEGLITTNWYTDADGDGYGTGTGLIFCSSPRTGWATRGGDCNDSNAAVNPGAPEICGNGIDDNCDGQVDDCCDPPVVKATTNGSSACLNDGIITITATPLSASYSYSLNGTSYQSSNRFTGLAAGKYTAYVKDARGCVVTVSGINVGMTVSAAIVDNATSCLANGRIVVSKTGGTFPFTHSLDGVNFVTSNVFTGLAEGTYTAWVKDANGCIASVSGITVGRASGMVVRASKVDNATACFNDGRIIVSKTGGTFPFTHSLDGVNFVTSNVFTGLAEGTYTAWVKDANGCVASVSGITVTRPPGMTVRASTVDNATACLNNGRIIVSKTGGVFPFTHSLDGVNFVTSNVFTGLSEGSYTAWVKDANGCVASVSGIIVGRTGIKVTASTQAASNCLDDGRIILSKTGGSFPFTHSLDGVNFGTNNVFTGLAAGTYTGWVKDGNGCVDSLAGITVGKAAAITASFSKANSTTCPSNGSITLVRTGGVSPYTYSIDGVNYVTSNRFTNLAPGTYTGYVKDARCPAVTTTAIVVTGPACAAPLITKVAGNESVTIVEPTVKVSPIPANTMLNITLSGYNGNTGIQLMTMQGKIAKQEKLLLQPNRPNQLKINVSAFAPAMYLLVVTDDKGNQKTEKVLIVH